jgi:phenylpropionate dioxygenase-like ring-hydroxylating dioxygenase large terminal subunit
MALPKYVRPQKHNSWFNVLPVRDFKRLKSSRVSFLDSFVTVEASGGEPGYAVRYEGVHPMHVTVQFGFICVWFGDDLDKPGWPFPTLFARSFGHDFVVTKPRLFKNTNLLDLIENNGDQIHFKTVHQWLSVNICDHEYTDRVFRLQMSGEIQYARSADSAVKRKFASFLPTSTYSQDLAFHGPGFGAGQVETDAGLKANLVLAFTPVGEHDLKLHLAASVDDTSMPLWLRTLFRLIPFVSLHDLLSWGVAKAGIDDTDGDYRIWRHKKSLKDPKLLPGEADIIRIRQWMSQYYLKDFEQPAQTIKPGEQKRWTLLGRKKEISAGKIYPFTVSGEEVVAYKTSGGELRVFEAHCPHQGAHLGHGGKLKDDCIACPFHLFYFNPNGEFVGTSTKGKPKSLMRLNQVEHRVLGNRIEVLV